MKKILAVVVLFCAWSGLAFAKETQLEKANNVLNEIMRTPDKGIPHDLLEKAVCVGIVPAEVKAALLVGGTYGRGVLVCRKKGDGPWGAPSMFCSAPEASDFKLGARRRMWSSW